jgi:hypothetical protein
MESLHKREARHWAMNAYLLGNWRFVIRSAAALQ